MTLLNSNKPKPGYTKDGIPVAKDAANRRWQKIAVVLGFLTEYSVLHFYYVEMAWTPTKIAKYIAEVTDDIPVTAATIRNRLEKCGIERRGPGGANYKGKGKWDCIK